MLDRFLSTLSVVSRIPIKPRFKFDSSRMDLYLPITGIFPALIALLLFAIGSLLVNIPDVLIVILILIAQYLGFNLFHLDGLMDSADAFLGCADKEKRLLILKDSRIGVYGFFAGASVLGLKAALLWSLFPFARDYPALVFAYPLWGRLSAALIPCMAKPLNSGSLGALAKDSRLHRCVFGIALALLLWVVPVQGLFMALLFPTTSIKVLRVTIAAILCPCAISPLAAFYYARLYRNSLGGYTGDALGAAIETTEVLYELAVLCISLVI